jgi:geranylgeranyl pyrophosphate synthase
MQPVSVELPADQPAAGAATDLPASLSEPLAMVEEFLSERLTKFDLPANLLEAASYSLLGGGKRLRPLLVLHSCAACGVNPAHAVPAAAAVEMIHAFSLVHDDLPALDNDSMRRGRPTLHVAHGHAMAILAGDGLMSAAFQVLGEDHTDPALAGRLCLELADGTTRMIAGQVLDTLGGFPEAQPAPDRLRAVHANKTGALIRASCRMGAMVALANPQRSAAAAIESRGLHALSRYGEDIGLMFQIVDDLIDVEQTAEHTGKRTGKDQDAGKLTYPGVFGVPRCREEVERLRAAAQRELDLFGPAAEALRRICDYMAVRTK